MEFPMNDFCPENRDFAISALAHMQLSYLKTGFARRLLEPSLSSAPNTEPNCRLEFDLEDLELKKQQGEDFILDMQSQTLVVEDRAFVDMLRHNIPKANCHSMDVVDFDTKGPRGITELQTAPDYSYLHRNLLFSGDIFSRITGSETFHKFIDPTCKHEELVDGMLGTMISTRLYSDAFRTKECRIGLHPDEIFLLSDPKYVGTLVVETSSPEDVRLSFDSGKVIWEWTHRVQVRAEAHVRASVLRLTPSTGKVSRPMSEAELNAFRGNK